MTPQEVLRWTTSTEAHGDGYSDILISGPTGNESVAYLVRGRPSWPAELSLAEADHQFLGADASNHGWISLSAGDVDGDDRSDVLVGFPDEDPNAVEDAGEAIVFFGHALLHSAP